MSPRILLCLLLAALAAGCGEQEMAEQQRLDRWERTSLFADGKVAQLPVEGTVPRGHAEQQAALDRQPPMTAQLLERGRERFGIFCAPCHGPAGLGDGIVVQRGFPPPPSYLLERLRTAPPGYIVDVITHGFGAMYAYADRVPPADRWAIAAYVEALQLAQHAEVAVLPDSDRQHLAALPP